MSINRSKYRYLITNSMNNLAVTKNISHPLTLDEREKMVHKLRETTTGIDAEYQLASGESSRRVYLDSTASTLQLGVVTDVMQKYLPYYANTHTNVHFSAILSSHEFAWAHQMVLDFVEANSEKYGSFFVGSGTTGCINRVARTLSRKHPERDVVITTIMEHHSNDLPHRKHFNEVVHVPVTCDEKGFGPADINKVEEALKKYGDRVNYISITGVSNVTGIVNPIYEVAELAHRHGTIIMVDAAQMAAHVPIQVSHPDNPLRDLDIVVMSGHKIYATGSPGVVVTRLDLFSDVEPEEVGGGMVDDVHIDRYQPTVSFPDREEAGTPNIAGAIGLATALYALKKIGMDYIDQEETAIVRHAIEELAEMEDVVVYGQTDCNSIHRTGALSFNIRGMHHSMTASILNDYFNIAVRNACFCAHPYVREMIMDDLSEHMDGLSNEELEAMAELHRGMVRASFGIYNTHEDVDKLVSALKEIVSNRAFYDQHYEQIDPGTYRHKTFRFESNPVFSASSAVDAWFENK